ncbi:MAG: type II toxin-antitoxin system HicB family antitoxin [Vicinamibacterales bacterium]
MDYLVIFERGEEGYGAYVPDLPGCVAAASTKGEVEMLIREALALHVRGMREDGLPVPEPTSTGGLVAVNA